MKSLSSVIFDEFEVQTNRPFTRQSFRNVTLHWTASMSGSWWGLLSLGQDSCFPWSSAHVSWHRLITPPVHSSVLTVNPRGFADPLEGLGQEATRLKGSPSGFEARLSSAVPGHTLVPSWAELNDLAFSWAHWSGRSYSSTMLLTTLKRSLASRLHNAFKERKQNCV